VESGLLLDVVVGESAAVFKLLAGEDQALLVWGNALLVLDLGLDVVDGVGRLNLEGDSLAGEGLHEDLHTTTQTEDEVEGALLLDVVIAQGAAILELLSGEDKALLVWGNALLVLDLALHIVDGVAGLNLEGDGLAGDCEAVSMRCHLDVGAAASGVDLRVLTKICMVAVGVLVDLCGCGFDGCRVEAGGCVWLVVQSGRLWRGRETLVLEGRRAAYEGNRQPSASVAEAPQASCGHARARTFASFPTSVNDDSPCLPPLQRATYTFASPHLLMGTSEAPTCPLH
jgi:hypothetical protein